jgi:uncharacterized protein (DUF58 family)
VSRLAVAPGGGSRSPAVAALTSAATPRLADLAPEQALRRLELTVLRRLDGLLQGDHLGLLPGPGSEPAEARAYRPGEDDVRRIDWSVTARTAVTHVRDATADRELETWVLVDRSASMDFGTARMEKRDLAVAAVASVGFLTARDGNRLGCHLLHHGTTARVPDTPGSPGPPRAPPAAPRRPPDALAVGSAAGARPGTDRSRPAAPSPRAAGRRLRLRRHAVRRRTAVVGAPAAPARRAPPGARRRGARPARARAARCRPADGGRPRDRPAPGGADVEAAAPRGVRRAAAAQRATVRAAVRRAGAGHLVLRTDRDWVLDVARFAARQRSLAAAAPVSRRTR